MKEKYAADKAHVYLGRKIIPGADSQSFQQFAERESLYEMEYSKDKAQVFWKDQRFTVSDPAAFRPLGLEYGRDEKHV